MNSFEAFAQLRRAHSHQCPKCKTFWGCTQQGVHKCQWCNACDPQVVYVDARHWVRLRFSAIESIDVTRQGSALRVTFKGLPGGVLVSEVAQVRKALQCLVAEVGRGDEDAVRLAITLRDNAVWGAW